MSDTIGMALFGGILFALLWIAKWVIEG